MSIGLLIERPTSPKNLLSHIAWDVALVMIRLGQAFWHQETAAIIDGQLWKLAVTPWEVLILIGQLRQL